MNFFYFDHLWVSQIFFLPKDVQLIYMKEASILFDKELRVALGDIVVGGGSFFRDL